jgi:23S rRNA (cytidine2498-2'-O)-methyltransferase
MTAPYLDEELASYGLSPILKNNQFILIENKENISFLWAQVVMSHIEVHQMESTSGAIKFLKSLPNFKVDCSLFQSPKTALMRKELSRLPYKDRLLFNPTKPSGNNPIIWGMLSPTHFFTAVTSDPIRALGDYEFVEDKTGPVSRAYLKLWEVFTRIQQVPKPHETVLELGCSPGGWTAVLASYAKEVIAIDKAPLDPKVAALPNVKYSSANAFALKEEIYANAHWIFSDVIAYASVIRDFILRICEKYPDINVVITVKFQGKTDRDVIDSLRVIPKAKFIHLYHNKHEVTFIRLK